MLKDGFRVLGFLGMASASLGGEDKEIRMSQASLLRFLFGAVFCLLVCLWQGGFFSLWGVEAGSRLPAFASPPNPLSEKQC